MFLTAYAIANTVNPIDFIGNNTKRCSTLSND